MNFFWRHAMVLLLSVSTVSCASENARMTEQKSESDTGVVRVATYNVSLFSDEAGGVIRRLSGGEDSNAKHVAAVIQRVRPDVLLLNEFDYDEQGALADLFTREYLGRGQFGESAIRYPYRYFSTVNTGVLSGMDLNRDGDVGGAGRKHGEDSFGFGSHPGQYGMLVLSRYPIDTKAIRTFQFLPWSTMPNVRRPKDPATGQWWYDDSVWPKLRLSSKSHWDVPIQTPVGVMHFLVSHPTPPVFDGPEDRNGLRNADELALWRHYLDGGELPWLCDDKGICGGLASGARFVIAGDLNNDPIDGDGEHQAILDLIEHPRVMQHVFPRSEGALAHAAANPQSNATHRSNPAFDTGLFGGNTGNLHLDYVLPSKGFQLKDSGVFWPLPNQTGADWITASDHHLVWLDLAVEPSP